MKSLSLEELIRTVLIPLIVGILVELFSYWLNH
ncbi:type I toxin-antitoxin system Fst family toxin [Selenomonas ruminantium]|nr:type I toxin-antitoxin system Fst family toxin [Selenomonas ruminantium]